LLVVLNTDILGRFAIYKQTIPVLSW
jgi:hypothetical protein